MIDFSVGLAWVALTVASAKGLAAFGRAAAASPVGIDGDLLSPAGELALAPESFWRQIDAYPYRLHESR
jgi:hypothetical protein